MWPTNPSARTNAHPAASAAASASRFAPARIWTPVGSPPARAAAWAATVMAAVISGPGAVQVGTSCMFSTSSASTPASR